ncbi:SWI/SNF related, matrix associated, actin dependent regulator of chromatin, subfamily e, member 1 [Homo sapiens]|uniref:SWI/SNF related BAF chromatin remodeling complex subunit E1 n=1 Tax=Homo sapiens TaxID=9606 RepID=A0A2R8YDD9_HUMAN|nr:SWI/SNF related, matrix associated, actin dependent regulator of chromatin, subfamily e, member 1 [Homo sapiens]KAI4049359.1 SWI/SNF related, matrix associated, actin dependent regulator of chromatin, subfamily e, member 1 [Homo sapiens]
MSKRPSYAPPPTPAPATVSFNFLVNVIANSGLDTKTQMSSSDSHSIITATG